MGKDILLQRKSRLIQVEKQAPESPPAKCLSQGAGEEEQGAGSSSPSLEWGTAAFIQCPQASREPCFSRNWSDFSSPGHIWGASRWGDLTQQAERDTRPRAFHLQSQQVWGCIPVLQADPAQGCGGCSRASTSQKPAL